MRNLILFVCLTYAVKTHAQIIAGEHSAADYFYDAIPDAWIHDTSYYGVTTYPIDINNDFINDFEFKVRWAHSPGGADQYCYMKMLNNSEGAFSHFDSCFAINGDYLRGVYSARAFYDGDSINENAVWSNHDLYMSENDATFSDHYCAFNNFCSSDTCYAGIRIFTLRDTLYGWIKVTRIQYDSFILLEYACNQGPPQIEELLVYPVPVADEFTIQLKSRAPSEITLFDVRGRKLLQKSFVHSILINTSQFSRGIYFYEVISENGFFKTGKVVKQ